ncbi:hypothetical protein INT45_008407 [Circinella minor]|uniref:Uncharacterized protein n=1 Tax=Circinella minor TaxID=1195481 RepID=A0A8H7RRC5_9FUNG|nr:hypothetical protein INT45_008407 [Circinella minor]
MSVSTGAPEASDAPAAAVASAVGDTLVGGAVGSATAPGVSAFLGTALPVDDSVVVRFSVARVCGREDGGLDAGLSDDGAGVCGREGAAVGGARSGEEQQGEDEDDPMDVD